MIIAQNARRQTTCNVGQTKRPVRRETSEASKTQNEINKYVSHITYHVLPLFVLSFTLFAFSFTNVNAVSPAPAKKLVLLTASPSATPTSTEDAKIQEIRNAIKEKVNEIKEKIEKKAYVGNIIQITDSTLTLNNFRGTQRVRLTAETIIIGGNKKEIKPNELAVDDKIIAMGTMSDNDILGAKRVIVVPKPKTTPQKRTVFIGTITIADSKKSLIVVAALNNFDKTLELKVDTTTIFVSPTDPKVTINKFVAGAIKFKDLKENQKVIVIYPEPAEGKTILAKTIFILP